MKTLKFNTIKDISKLQKIGVEINFEAEEEDINPFDILEDKGANYVIEKYNSGNMAAWFSAKITVKYKDFEEVDYLGGCSYKSFEAFKKDGYYRDMIYTCVNGINAEIELYNKEIQKNWDIRKAKNLLRPYGLSVIDKNKIEKSYL